MKETLPQKITAIRAFTYEVAEIVADIANDSDKSKDEVTLDEVMEVIRYWASDDLDADPAAISYRFIHPRTYIDQDNELVEG